MIILFIYIGGFLVSFNDVAGPFAGVVFGISNTFATTSGIIIPYFVAAVTKNVTIYFEIINLSLNLFF